MERTRFDHIVIAWKDTSEARRAIAEALPLLYVATRVTVVEIVSDADLTNAVARCDNVVTWLQRHGIQPSAKPSASEDEAAMLLQVTEDADLIVAGAYGHNRLREWVLGA